MRHFFISLLTALLLQLGLASVYAQQDVTNGGRPTIKKVVPTYPAVAKRMSLSGLVKVEVIIDPRGTVKNTKIVGGSPVLASAAEQAVRQWVFQAGPDTTTQIVEFRFQSEE